MHRLEVLIEENAFGSVRPVEVVADAPVGALVPALVEELRLPETDLFGKKLVYMLRHTSGGRILPENTTLLASGVESGATLALDSYVLDGTVATLAQNVQVPLSPVSPDPVLHSSITIPDGEGFAPPPTFKNTSGSMPYLPQKREYKSSRRVFLALGGAVLGVGGAGLGYAAYHAYTSGTLKLNAGKAGVVQPTAATPRSSPAPTKALFPTTAQTIFTFNNHQKTVQAIGWSPDGTMIASGAADANVFVWLPNGTIQRNIPHPGPVMALAWAADGQRLVTGAQNQVLFYNVQVGKTLATHHHTKPVTNLAWSAHNQMWAVSASQDTHAIVWNTTTYQRQTTFMRHTTSILGVSWSADGQAVASGTQGGIIRVWRGNNAQELHGAYYLTVPVGALAFAPSGTQLAAGGDDGMVRIWNGLTCQQQANASIANQCIDVPPVTLQASTTPVHTLAWSPDGRFLAVGTDDGKVTVWYPAQNTHKPIITVQQNSAVRSLAWSPKGDQLASASGNSVTIWGVM